MRQVLREGFCDVSQGLYQPGAPVTSSGRADEHGSMEENFGDKDFKKLRHDLKLPRKEGVRRPKRLRHKCSLFPEPSYTGAKDLDIWLKHLAVCERPLSSLAKEVPYISSTYSRGREVLNRLSEHQVPLLRATWFVKVTVSRHNFNSSRRKYFMRLVHLMRLVYLYYFPCFVHFYLGALHVHLVDC